jgi:hypothetical protein
VVVAVSVADGDHRLAHLQVARGAHRHHGQLLGRVDLQERQVVAGVAGDDQRKLLRNLRASAE